MTADEARVRPRLGEDSLGRPHIGDDRVGARALERRSDGLGERAYRRRNEDHLGALDRAAHLLRARLDRSQLERSGGGVLVGVVPRDLRARAPARRQPDRTADQPKAEDRHPQGVRPRRTAGRALAARRGRSAIRRR